MKKKIYITSAILLFIVAYFLYKTIRPDEHFTPYDFQPVNRYNNNTGTSKQNLPSNNTDSDNILFISGGNNNWIGSLHISKLYFRASVYIPYDKIPLDTNTVVFYTHLIEQSPLQIGDTVWSCLPEGYFITSIVDTLILYLNDYDSERNFIEYSAKPINLPENFSKKQYTPVLIYNTPPIKNIYAILSQDSISNSDSSLFENISSDLYPRMSKTWIDTFRINLDEESKQHYPDTFKFTFNKEINYYKIKNNSTNTQLILADMAWFFTGSGIRSFGTLMFGKNNHGKYTSLWLNEWYSKPEMMGHDIECEGLYYDNAGHLTMLLLHTGWEWGRREVLYFDEQTNCFIVDDSYIDLY